MTNRGRAARLTRVLRERVCDIASRSCNKHTFSSQVVTTYTYDVANYALASADLLTLRKLLTTHIRADRFTEGHLESGHITAILRQLKQIRDAL